MLRHHRRRKSPERCYCPFPAATRILALATHSPASPSAANHATASHILSILLAAARYGRLSTCMFLRCVGQLDMSLGMHFEGGDISSLVVRPNRNLI